MSWPPCVRSTGWPWSAKSMRHDSIVSRWLRPAGLPRWHRTRGRSATRVARTRCGYRGKEARADLARTIGTDGRALQDAMAAPGAPAWLRELPAVESSAASGSRTSTSKGTVYSGGPTSWACRRPHATSVRPTISEAHLAKKRSTQWVGYKLHLTETCDDDLPAIITHVGQRRSHLRWRGDSARA